MKTLLSIILLCGAAHGQVSMLLASQAAAGNTFTHLSDGTPATYTMASATTTAFNTTGSKLNTCLVAGSNSATIAVTDSAMNSYTQRGHYGPDGNSGGIFLFDVISPSNSSTLVVTASGTGIYAMMGCSAFGDTGTPSYDAQNGTNAVTSASPQTGSLTASNPNSLYVAGGETLSGNTPTAIDSPFTLVTGSVNSGCCWNVGGGWYIQSGSATAQNPHVTLNTSISASLIIASYKP